jgi:hypothetical protein
MVYGVGVVGDSMDGEEGGIPASKPGLCFVVDIVEAPFADGDGDSNADGDATGSCGRPFTARAGACTPLVDERCELGSDPACGAVDVAAAASPLAVGVVTAGVVVMCAVVLSLRLFRAAGAGLTANSCAPGVGGGRNEEEGDGKGDTDASPSRAIESRDARGSRYQYECDCYL